MDLAIVTVLSLTVSPDWQNCGFDVAQWVWLADYGVGLRLPRKSLAAKLLQYRAELGGS